MLLTIVISLLLLLTIFVIIYNFFLYEMKLQELRLLKQINQETKNTVNISPPVELGDPLLNFDKRVIADPLKEPLRRPSRDVLGPILVNNPLLNIATRGYPDNYTQQGYLVDNKTNKNDPNMIIPLFGRQKYPQSVEYEYYIVMNIGGFERKYMLDRQKRELYDGDKVFVDILKRHYEVKLFKSQGLEYNPFLI